MRRPRLFLAGPLVLGQSYWIEESDAHHLLRVLRLGVGDAVLASDGVGHDYQAELISASRGRAQLKLVEALPALPEPARPLRLCVALAKGDRYEGVIEKAAELGVARFTPVLSERCTASEVSPSRQQRWQRLAREGCALAGRSHLLQLDAPIRLAALLEHESGVLFTGGSPALQGNASTLLIGPEGGFSDAEVELAAQFGWSRAGLGPRTLRVETAATVAVALALQQSGDLS